MTMVSLDPLVNAELNLIAASEFDGIDMSLRSSFPEVEQNFGVAAATISDGFTNG